MVLRIRRCFCAACGDCSPADIRNIGNVLDFTYNFSLGAADNGNVTGIANNRDNTRSQNFTYDALNRIASVTGTLGTTAYTYDAMGQRVRKTVSGVTTDYVYDPEGHAIVEVNGSGGANREEIFAGGKHIATYVNNTTYFTHADWLGTERVRSDMTGAACETITSLPFGDGQSTSGSCGDPSTRHFTDKERDPESGLDNFGARYYSSAMARFTAADPHLTDSQRMRDPQQLNMYSYARNNPLRFGDDGGEDVKEKVVQKTYTVHGATAAEAHANALQTSGIKTDTGEAMMGNTSASIRVVYKDVSVETTPGTEATGSTAFAEVKSADVLLNQTITTPTWEERGNASPEEQQAWDKDVAGLQKHEEGHADINRQGAQKLDKALPGTSGYGTGKTPGDAQNNAVKQMSKNVNQKSQQNKAETQQKQRDYDKKTDHGRKQPND